MGMASTSLKVFLSVHRGLFKTVVWDCGRVTESYWNQALLALWRSGTSSPEIQSLSCLNQGLPFTCPLSALFQGHSFSYLPSNFQYKAVSAKHASTPLYHHSDPCSEVWPDWFSDGQLKNTNSAESVFSALKPSMFRRPESMGSKTELSWTSCSRTNPACAQRKTDGRREIPEEHMVDGARNKSTEMNCRFGEMRGWLHCLPWNNMLSLCRMFEIWISI